MTEEALTPTATASIPPIDNSTLTPQNYTFINQLPANFDIPNFPTELVNTVKQELTPSITKQIVQHLITHVLYKFKSFRIKKLNEVLRPILQCKLGVSVTAADKILMSYKYWIENNIKRKDSTHSLHAFYMYEKQIKCCTKFKKGETRNPIPADMCM
jgi:hypothetical protein